MKPRLTRAQRFIRNCGSPGTKMSRRRKRFAVNGDTPQRFRGDGNAQVAARNSKVSSPRVGIADRSEASRSQPARHLASIKLCRNSARLKANRPLPGSHSQTSLLSCWRSPHFSSNCITAAYTKGIERPHCSIQRKLRSRLPARK
jgi:hypothetical protein